MASQQPDKSKALGLGQPPKMPLAQRYQWLRKMRDTILGHIYLGQDNITRVNVAIKASSIKKNFSGNYMENAIDENRIMEYLAKGNNGRGHPHICKLIEQETTADWHFAVYEWLTGGELLDFVLQHGRLTEAETRATFIKLCSAVQYMHRMNICHLDISAENIMLASVPTRGPDGLLNLDVKIIDFGLARSVLPGVIFRGGRYGGKVGYMSPEMFYQKDFDPRSADVYAMGVVLFLLATGAAPYSQSRSGGGGPRTPDFYETYQGRLAGLLQRWRIALSPELVDLIQHILCPPVAPADQPTLRRLTLAEIMQHPWVRGVRLPTNVAAPAAPVALAVPVAPVVAQPVGVAGVAAGAAAAASSAEEPTQDMSDIADDR